MIYNIFVNFGRNFGIFYFLLPFYDGILILFCSLGEKKRFSIISNMSWLKTMIFGATRLG